MGKSKDLATGNSAAYVETAGDTMTGRLTISGATVNYATSPILQFNTTGTNTDNRNWAMGPVDDYYGNFHIFRSQSQSDSDAVDAAGRSLTITKEGYVKKPNTPCFGARGYSGTTTQIGSYNPMLWVNVHTNVGNCFSNSTGKFTFPVSGRYYVECNINLKTSDGSWLGLYFLYNTSAQMNSWSEGITGSQYNNTIVSGVIDAAANDYCAFCWHNSYIAPAGSSHPTYNYANIYFIG